MRIIIFTPCRVTFALLTLCAYAVHPDEASHITVGEPPRPTTTANPQPRGDVG